MGNTQSLQGRVARVAARKQLLTGWYLGTRAQHPEGHGSELVEALHPWNFSCSSNALTLVERCNNLRRAWLHRQPLAGSASSWNMREGGLLCELA